MFYDLDVLRHSFFVLKEREREREREKGRKNDRGEGHDKINGIAPPKLVVGRKNEFPLCPSLP